MYAVWSLRAGLACLPFVLAMFCSVLPDSLLVIHLPLGLLAFILAMVMTNRTVARLRDDADQPADNAGR
nr:hypothetical protein [Maliibacterium massiliense]